MFLQWWRTKAKRKPTPLLKQPRVRPSLEWLEDRRLLSSVPGKENPPVLHDAGDGLLANYAQTADVGPLGDTSSLAVTSPSTATVAPSDDGSSKNNNLNAAIVSILDDGSTNSVNFSGTLTSVSGTDVWKSAGDSTGANLVSDIITGIDGTSAGTWSAKGFVPGHRHHRGKGRHRHRRSDPSLKNQPSPTVSIADSGAKLETPGADVPVVTVSPLPPTDMGPSGSSAVSTAALPPSSSQVSFDTGSNADTVPRDAGDQTLLVFTTDPPGDLESLQIEVSSLPGSGDPQAVAEPANELQPAGPVQLSDEAAVGDASQDSFLVEAPLAMEPDGGAGQELRVDSMAAPSDVGQTAGIPEPNLASVPDVKRKEASHAIVFGLSINMAPAGNAVVSSVGSEPLTQLDGALGESELAALPNAISPAAGGDRLVAAAASHNAASTAELAKATYAAIVSSNMAATEVGTPLLVFVPGADVVLEHEDSTLTARLPVNAIDAEHSGVSTTGRTLPFFVASFNPVLFFGQEDQKQVNGRLFVEDVHATAASPESWVSGNGSLWGLLFSYALVLPFGPKRHQPTIMLAEGDEATRDAMTVLLVHEGYLVLPAATAHDALGVLRAPISPIDVVLLDTHLPDVNGVHLCQRLRELYPTLPVLVCTGEAEPAEVAQLLKLGVQHYLRKPIVLHELLTTVRSLLR
jgi:CheY-like chemotaxis protein